MSSGPRLITGKNVSAKGSGKVIQYQIKYGSNMGQQKNGEVYGLGLGEPRTLPVCDF